MKTTRPLAFYSAAVYIGCAAYITGKDSRLLGAVITASFLIIILLTLEKRFSLLVILFFILGFFSISLYYSTGSISKDTSIKVTKVSSYNSIGSINGRKVFISGNIKDVKEGEILYAQGSFKEVKDFYKGIVGEFAIEKIFNTKYSLTYHLYNIKRKVYEELCSRLGDRKTGLIMSLCFGETKYVSEDQRSDFQELGVVHAISVSGFHMAVIYKLLEGTLGMWTSIALSFLYLIFTGSQAATVRAFLMILVLRLSKRLFRNYDAVSSLCFSALIILTAAPYYAADLGFMLSYLSTLGIILYYNKIKRTLYKLPTAINESLSLTISAQTFSMPYAALSLGNMGFGFLIGNLILMPLYTAVVVLGNAALVFLIYNPLFNILCKILFLLVTALEGAHYLLLKLTPPVSYLSYMESIVLFSIIASFILVKKGYNRFKTVPALMIIVLLMQYYSFFPELQFLTVGKEKMVLLKYKTERILIHNNNTNFSDNFELVRSRLMINRWESAEKGLTIRFGKLCTIKVLSDYRNNNSMALMVSSLGRNTIITTENPENMDVDLKKYDIIKLPDFNDKETLNTYRNKIKVLGYKIILNRIYAGYSAFY